MTEIFTTSYENPELLTWLVKGLNAKTIVEVGSQQGNSTVALGRGLGEGSRLVTVDRFDEKYDAPPHLETHARKDAVEANLKNANLKCNFEVIKGDGLEFLKHFQNQNDHMDVFHCDICNHYDNLKPILEVAVQLNPNMILLEGGIHNKWQQKYDFKSYAPMLEEPWLKDFYTYVTIPFNEHNAITVLTKRK